jgi:hypothetical protein
VSIVFHFALSRDIKSSKQAVHLQRKIADKVGCGLSEFPSVVDELRGNGILMKKTDGSFQVIS